MNDLQARLNWLMAIHEVVLRIQDFGAVRMRELEADVALIRALLA